MVLHRKHNTKYTHQQFFLARYEKKCHLHIMTIIQWSRANAKITRATILAVNIPALHNVWKIMPPQVITFLSARIILKAELYAAETHQTNSQA